MKYEVLLQGEGIGWIWEEADIPHEEIIAKHPILGDIQELDADALTLRKAEDD